MSRGRRFALNVVWTMAGQAGVMAINFISIPYLLRGFGVEAYGVYLLMYTVGGYLGLFQCGAGLATIRFVAEARAAGEERALRDALRHSAAIHFGFVGLAALALWAAAGWLVRAVFKVPVYYEWHALWLLRAAAAGGVCAAGGQWVSAVFQGLQRFGWPSALGLLQAALMPLGLVAVLATGRGLGAAAAWYVAVQFACFALGALALSLALRGSGGDRGRMDFWPFFRYGFSFAPAALSGLAATQIDKAFVAGLLSMSELTLYAVPSGVLQRVQTLPAAMAHALIPVLGEAAGERERLTRIYLRSTRALLTLSVPVLGLLFALAPQLLSLWLGPMFSGRAAVAIRLLVVAQAFAVLAQAPAALAAGLGGGRLTSGVAWGQTALSLALWPLLIPRWGIVGAAAGALTAQALPAAFYLHAAQGRFLGLGWGRAIRELAGPLALPTAALLAAAWAGRAWAWSWPGLLAVGAAAAAVYAALAWRLLPAEDASELRRWLELAKIRS